MTSVQLPIEPELVRIEISARSKKHALEIVSGLLADATGTLNPNEIFEALILRERLGCTAIGNGVALPHGRLESVEESVAVFARLTEAVGFDAADGEPADLIFALLVPAEGEASETENIARLARWFSDAANRTACREAENQAQIRALFTTTEASTELPAGAERRAV